MLRRLRNVQKSVVYTCKVVVLLSKLIAFSPFLLPSPSSSLSSLKFPIVVIQKFCYHGDTVTSHFSSLLLCFQNLARKTFPIVPRWLCLQSNWCLNLKKFIPTITISVGTLLIHIESKVRQNKPADGCYER